MRKYLPGTYRTFYGPEFRPFSNGGRKFGAALAKNLEGFLILVYEEECAR